MPAPTATQDLPALAFVLLFDFLVTLPLPLSPTTRKAPRMNGWMRQK